MSQDCPLCPVLREEIARLHERVRYLHAVLATTIGATKGVITFITREQERPSMPRARLLPAVQARLTGIVEEAEGRSR